MRQTPLSTCIIYDGQLSRCPDGEASFATGAVTVLNSDRGQGLRPLVRVALHRRRTRC
jgi:hypothetical protein